VQTEKDFEEGMDTTRRYHGKIQEVFGWEDTAYLVIRLAHTVDGIEEHDPCYNHLDNHCESIRFVQPDDNGQLTYQHHWLELNLAEVESNVHLTQFMPDFRRMHYYMVNAFDGFNVTQMGDVQRDLGAVSDEDLHSLAGLDLELTDCESDAENSSVVSEPFEVHNKDI
jgi:hypothetical protein